MYTNFLLDTILVNPMKTKSCKHWHLPPKMADQLATRISIFSCSSEGLWNDLNDQSQQSSMPWLVSQPRRQPIMLRLSTIFGS